MKRKTTGFFLVMMVLLCFLCTACGGDSESAENVEGTENSTLSPKDDPNEGLGGDVPALNEDTGNDFSMYEGIWLGEANNKYDYIEFDADGNWQLYLTGDVVDEGYLRYELEWEAVYAYSSLDDSGSRIALENGQLYITSFGYFNYGGGMEYYRYEGGGDHDGDMPTDDRLTEDDESVWNGNDSGKEDAYYSWNSELCQRNVSEFQGVWYYDGDLSAETYIVIDGDGNWSYYQRAPGAETAEMDSGILAYSTDEVSTYYAESTMYDGLSIRVYEFDTDMLVWGNEGVYYLME